jgi:lipopolysaccharide export system protein LptA
MSPHKIIAKFLGPCLLLSCALGFAKAPPKLDPNTPIHIQSDSASFAQISQHAVHQGNVIMKQGDHILHADKLTIQKDPKGKLSVITAVGKPATFSGSLSNDPHPVFATAKIIYYYPEKQLIVLEGAATLDHEKDKFRGPTLSYQLDTQIISAVRKNNGKIDERPTVTIHPRA